METTVTVLIVFTGIVALALLLQAFALLAISRKIRELSAQFDAVSAKLTKQIDALSVQADTFLTVLKTTAERVQAVQENVAAVSKVVHNRVVEMDAFLTEATDAARLQIAKFQDVIDTTSRRIEITIDTLQNAIVVPITEVQAVIRGVRTGLNVLFGWRHSSSRRSPQDEEMFI